MLTALTIWAMRVGRAQDRPPSETLAGHSTIFVSTPEGRAAGVEMVDLKFLAAELFTAAEEATYEFPDFFVINDSRQVIGRFGVFTVDHYVGHVLVFQLAVTPGGFHAFTGYIDLGVHLEPFSFNSSGDILCRDGELFIAGLGWGQLPPTLVKPGALSDRNGLNQAFLIGNDETAWPTLTGWRATLDMLTGNITGKVNLQGPFARDRSTTARGVNSAGIVVGKMVTGRSDERAYVYENGIMKNLGNLTTANSWNDSEASAVNSSGDVVGGGMTGVAPFGSGLLYVKSKNTTYDSAATLDSADRAAYELLRPRDHAAINNSGMICGSSGAMPVANVSASRAYLLEPAAP